MIINGFVNNIIANQKRIILFAIFSATFANYFASVLSVIQTVKKTKRKKSGHLLTKT